jgi:glycosyltransferase involved in cell wall biosynthesis
LSITLSLHRPRILLVYDDLVGAGMGGVGIRASELARVLHAHGQVTVAAAESRGELDGIPVVEFNPHDPRALGPHLERADVAVARPQWPLAMRMMRRSGARLIFDIYDPDTFATIEHYAERPPRRRRLMAAFSVDRLVEALRIGHHFVCASERQLDFYLGVMLAEGLISPAAYDRDSGLRSVIDVVPFGVPSDPPEHTGGPGIRDTFPAIAPDDEVVLWNGGLWDWLDAPTAIRSVAALAQRRPQVKLVFMGGSSGRPHRAESEARTLASELGLLERVVFFNSGWVPYERRADWLLSASCAISTHRAHIETRLAFRTRLLDCFWAGLPVVCTAGDELGERIECDGLGVTVPEEDPHAVAAGLVAVLERGKGAYAEGLRLAAQKYAWPAVAEPLVRFVTSSPAPPRLGSERQSRGFSAPRSTLYSYGRRALNAVGLSNWPRA